MVSLAPCESVLAGRQYPFYKPPEKRPSPASVRAAEARLLDLLGPGAVSASEIERVAVSRDFWPMGQTWFLQGKMAAIPDLVVWPRTTDEVAATLRVAQEFDVPVTPFGEGSGALGGAIPVAGGILLDLKKTNRFLHIDRENYLATVEAGLNGRIYEDTLAAAGFTGGHIRQSLPCSTIGGWLACRAAGQFSTRYGKIEDLVTGITAVLPDGRVLSNRIAPRTATGPQVWPLFLGSEGTLGVITEATLRVFPVPEKRVFASYAFSSVESGLDAIKRALHRGARPAVVRLYDDLETGRHFANVSAAEGKCLLVLIVEGDSRLVAAEEEILAEECRAAGAVGCGSEPVETWRRARFDISISSQLFRRGAIADTIEVAGGWDRIAAIYHAMSQEVGELEGTLVASGHFSHVYPDGACLYLSIAGFPPGEPAEYHQAVWEKAMDAVLRHGGAISHHHGIGFHRAPFLARERGEADLDALRLIKKAWDPKGILNPGKLGLDERGPAGPVGPAGTSADGLAAEVKSRV